MQIPLYKYGVFESRIKSAFIGENFLLIIVYSALVFIYISMAISCLVERKNHLIGAGFQGSSGISDFGFGMSFISEVASAFMVVGWIFMSIFKRAMVIGRYHVHPKTNILVEVMFLGSNICLLASDRLFINMLPAQVDIGAVIYPVAMSVVVATGLMIIYLFGKLVSKFLCDGGAAYREKQWIAFKGRDASSGENADDIRRVDMTMSALKSLLHTCSREEQAALHSVMQAVRDVKQALIDGADDDTQIRLGGEVDEKMNAVCAKYTALGDRLEAQFRARGLLE